MNLRRVKMTIKRNLNVYASLIFVVFVFLFIFTGNLSWTREEPVEASEEEDVLLDGFEEFQPAIEAPLVFTVDEVVGPKLTEAEIDALMDPKLKPLYGARRKGFSDPINEILYNFPTIGEANLAQFKQLALLEPDLNIRKSQRELPLFEHDRYVHVMFQNRHTFDCRDKETVYLIGTINESKHLDPDHTDKPKPTKGGSTFQVAVEGEKVGSTLCTVYDHLNGQYSWICPFAKYACLKVSILFTYLNFDAYRHYSHFIGLKRFDQELCIDEINKHSHCAIPHQPMMGLWDKTVFKSPDQSLKFDTTNSSHATSLCSCAMKKVQKLLVLVEKPEQGLKYECLRDFCGENGIAVEVHLLKNFLSVSTEDKQFVFIDLGMWNLQEGPRYALELFQKDLEPSIKPVIQKFGASYIALVSTTSTPQAIKEDMQNNAILAALSEVQRQFAKQNGFGFIDVFEPTYLKYKTGGLDHQTPNYFTNSLKECQIASTAKGAFAKMLNYLCKLQL